MCHLSDEFFQHRISCKILVLQSFARRSFLTLTEMFRKSLLTAAVPFLSSTRRGCLNITTRDGECVPRIPFCARFHLALYFKALLRANKNNCIHVEESAGRAVISVYKSARSKRPSRTKYRLYFVVDLRASCSRWRGTTLHREISLRGSLRHWNNELLL